MRGASLIDCQCLYSLDVHGPFIAPRRLLFVRCACGSADYIRLHAATILPQWWEAVSDTLRLAAAHAALPAEGGTIDLGGGATFSLDSVGGVLFSKRVHLFGESTTTFLVGAGVGNHPAITVSGDGSLVDHFAIVGDHANFTNAPLTSELRRSLKVTGDRVTVAYLHVSNSIVGINLNNAPGSTAHHCTIENALIRQGVGANNNHAGILVDGPSSADNALSDNRITGHGQGILVGGAGYRTRAERNNISGTDDNGIYFSTCASGCLAADNTVTGFDSVGIKVRGSSNTIRGNHVSSIAAISCIGMTGNGAPDANGINGRDLLAEDNFCEGAFTEGVGFGISDQGYPRGVTARGNRVMLTGGTARCIRYLADASVPALIDGVEFAHNRCSGHSIGIQVTHLHPSGRIANVELSHNRLNGGTDDNIQLVRVASGVIDHNLAKNGTGAGKHGILLFSATYLRVDHNQFGDDQQIPTQAKAIEEAGTSDHNRFINNAIAGVTDVPITLVGANSAVLGD
jgi:parallel beta-helix repeat protein